MKSGKRVTAFLLAIILLVSNIPFSSYANEVGESSSVEGSAQVHTTDPVSREPAAQEPEETKAQETEPQETKAQETEPQETEAQETEAQETEAQETEAQETEAQETEPQETEAQETEPQETEAQETELPGTVGKYCLQREKSGHQQGYPCVYSRWHGGFQCVRFPCRGAVFRFRSCAGRLCA